MNRTVAIAFFLGAFFASPAFGADAFVVTMSPGVLVNPGDGYMAVETLREVRAGDQVMANETGQGWIVYCGCDEELRPDKVYTVENRECKVEGVRLNELNYPHAVLPGDGFEVQEIKRCRWGGWGGGGGRGRGWYLLAIPAVGAAVGLAISGSDDSDGGVQATATGTSTDAANPVVAEPNPASP